MAYTPTVWVNGGVPAIDDTNLNHMETQYAQALADIPEDAAAGTPSERTLGTGALQSAAGDHGHTVSQKSEATDHWQEAIGASASGLAAAGYIENGGDTTSYTTTHTLTRTPTNANSLMVIVGTSSMENRQGLLVRMSFQRITIDAVQKEEVSADLEDFGATNEYIGLSQAFSESGDTGATDYDLDHKAEENGRGQTGVSFLTVVDAGV